MEKDYGPKNYLISIVSGGIAGMSVDIALFPLDTIKTRLQASLNKKTEFKITKSVSNYSGLKSQVISSFPAAAAFFSTYDYTKHILIHKNKIYEPIGLMISAILGEASQLLVRNPFELVKQNMQIGKYNSIIEALHDIHKHNGIMGLYRGYYISLLREIPFGLIQYPLYEFFKKKVKDNNSTSYAICGAKAGGIAAFLTTPIDVIKTRIMTSDTSLGFNKIINTILSIYNNEGMAKLFSGVHIRVLYISIGGMFFFGVNEEIKKILFFIP